MKITLLLTFVLCFASVSSVRCEAHEVYANCGDSLSGPPLNPVLTLQNLLDKHPRQSRFRVEWGSFGTLGGSHATLFYDRHRQILRLEQKSDFLADEEKRARASSLRKWFISGVSRVRIKRLIHWYTGKPNEDGSDVSFLSHLDRFGCRVRCIADFRRNYVFP